MFSGGQKGDKPSTHCLTSLSVQRLNDGGETMTHKTHRAFGCYGIATIDQRLIVIRKNGGPYIHRFDLPGGSLDGPEPLEHDVLREFSEETGLTATIDRQLGATSFVYPWQYERWTINQHICVFYALTLTGGQLASSVPQFTGQDSLGACALPLAKLTWENASPLVMFAKDYLQTGTPNLSTQTFNDWTVLKEVPTP